MFSVFQQAKKFDCLFLVIFKVFIGKLDPVVNKCFKRCFESFLVHIGAKDSLRRAKNVVFS